MTKWNLHVASNQNPNGIDIVLSELGNKTSNLSLPYIDWYTSQFKNSEDLCTHLLKMKIINFNPTKVYLRHIKAKQNNGITNDKTKEIIFSSSFIHNSMENILYKKKNKIKPIDMNDKKPEHNSNMIDNSIKDFDKFMNKILDILVKDETIFTNFIKNNDCYGLENDLKDYIKLTKLTFKTPNQEEELSKCNENINYRFRHYSSFRNLFIWYSKYQKLQSKKEDLANKEKEYYQIKLTDLAKLNQTEKELVVGNNIKVAKVVALSNPNISYYYNHGGLSNVMENCDLDEITSLPLEEQEEIGFTTQTKKRG